MPEAIDRVPLDALKPYPRNTRTHSKRQIEQIARSIERFGFTNPALVDDELTIYGTHGTLRVWAWRGWRFEPSDGSAPEQQECYAAKDDAAARVRVGVTAAQEEFASAIIQNRAPDPAPGPAAQVEGGEIGVALQRAVGLLPARQREAFLLRNLEGLDVAQTAAAMGCSEGSVKTHYSRAVHTLREQLGGFIT